MLLAWVLVILGINAEARNNFVVAKVAIRDQFGGKSHFVLHYDEIHKYKRQIGLLINGLSSNGMVGDFVLGVVENSLASMKYAIDFSSIYSQQALRTLVANTHNKHQTFNTLFEMSTCLNSNGDASLVPSFMLNSNQTTRIVLYQSLGAKTGGTTALNILHDTLSRLGYGVLLCNDDNKEALECSSIKAQSVIVTGEWCREVLNEYTSNEDPKGPDRYKYRGIQYYLGFHHHDTCRGRIAIADSHYISTLISSRVLGGYYLACPMAYSIQEAHKILLENDPEDTKIFKENLIVVDADFVTDYPPEQGIELMLPSGYQSIIARGIPPDEMPLLLQRAKIIIDLAMPGPERLSGEGIMLGAIPIISSRWNGASQFDFPGIRRIDPQNMTQVHEVLEYVTTHYEEELKAAHNQQFLTYISSLSFTLSQTADMVFGSSYLHFVIIANNLQEETGAMFQILGLLFMYPSASIDLYVTDVLWYMRHHYAFFQHLKQAGYIRIDPMDPTDYPYWRNEQEEGLSLVNVKSLFGLKKLLNDNVLSSLSLVELKLIPLWNPITILLPKSFLFTHPHALFNTEMISRDFRPDDYKIIDTVYGQQITIFSPFLDITVSLDLFRKYINSVQRQFDHGSNALSNDNIIHLCKLYALPSFSSQHHNNGDDFLKPKHFIHNVVNGTSWMMMKSIAMNSNFECS